MSHREPHHNATAPFDFNRYQVEYRRTHPDKAKRWRYNNCLNFVAAYLQEHEELRRDALDLLGGGQ